MGSWVIHRGETTPGVTNADRPNVARVWCVHSSERRLVSSKHLVAIVVVICALMGLLYAPSSGAVSVIGDEETERFVGSGAVLLPSTVPGTTRIHASTCVGCRWKVTAPCRRDDEHSDAGCRGTILGCPQGREIGRAWLARPGQDFEAVGLFCPSDGEVTSVADATARVRGEFERRIPPLRVKCAPQRGVVVGIPLHCHSLQPSARLSWVDSVAGYSVQTSAVATWEWNFQQHHPAGGLAGGWSHVAREPGADYPAAGIRQGFSIPGVHSVEVRARWRGAFTVDGLGPFPISPDLEQRELLQVPTGSALGLVRGPIGRA